MAKGIKTENDQQDDVIVKPFLITAGSIKEDQCIYSYEIMTGKCIGDKISNRKGSNYVHDDMKSAFERLNVHLAVIDDAFKGGKKIKEELSALAEHATTGNFSVGGFKVSGMDENEGYVISGEKYVTTGSISLDTPKISKNTGYQFFDDLKECIEAARNEVELYMEGKCAPKMEQTEIPFAAAGSEGGGDEFNNPM